MEEEQIKESDAGEQSENKVIFRYGWFWAGFFGGIFTPIVAALMHVCNVRVDWRRMFWGVGFSLVAGLAFLVVIGIFADAPESNPSQTEAGNTVSKGEASPEEIHAQWALDGVAWTQRSQGLSIDAVAWLELSARGLSSRAELDRLITEIDYLMEEGDRLILVGNRLERQGFDTVRTAIAQTYELRGKLLQLQAVLYEMQ